MLSMTVCRDYRTSTKFEYVIYEDEQIVARAGFMSYAAAKRAGQKAATEIYAERDRVEPELDL
jgi:hypothetical protein